MVRFKHRYVLSEIMVGSRPYKKMNLTKGQIARAITDALYLLHGDFGCAATKIRGTIRGCNKFLIKHNQKEIRRVLATCPTDEALRIRNAIMKNNLVKEDEEEKPSEQDQPSPEDPTDQRG